jgi:hypothetical protein
VLNNRDRDERQRALIEQAEAGGHVHHSLKSNVRGTFPPITQTCEIVVGTGGVKQARVLKFADVSTRLSSTTLLRRGNYCYCSGSNK